jgi:uncharacterized DUF497 family protein
MLNPAEDLRISSAVRVNWHQGYILATCLRCWLPGPVRSGLYILSATLALVIVSGFDWDDDNVLHIDRHQFSPDEVEEVFAGDYKVRRTRQKLYIALGETLDGRLAFVVFRRLPGGSIRVVTARDMDNSERRLFRRK